MLLLIIGGREVEKERPWLRKGQGEEEKTEPVNIHVHTMICTHTGALELSVARHYEPEGLGSVKSKS
jgi:hypothetical protein